MKRILFLAMIQFLVFVSFAQNSEEKMDDKERIALTPYLSQELNFSEQVKKQLVNKMNQILSKNGMAGTRNNRFIITANAVILDEDIITTTTTMYQYKMEVSFYVGDGIDGKLFSNAVFEVKGLGETKADAFVNAIKNVKTSDSKFTTLLNEGKTRIVEYYNSKCDFIIQEAQTLAQQQEFDYAIYKLTGVPDVCKECYDKCMSAVQPIFQQKIDLGGEKLLAEARAIWNAGLDMYAAEQASDILAMINPSSKAYSGAVKLSQEIAKRVAEIDKREWNRLLKQEQDAVDLRKAEIKAIRDIGVAYGEHQQPTTYNVRWW